MTDENILPVPSPTEPLSPAVLGMMIVSVLGRHGFPEGCPPVWLMEATVQGEVIMHFHNNQRFVFNIAEDQNPEMNPTW